MELRSGLQFFSYQGATLAFDFEPSQAETKHLLVLVNGYQRTRQDFRVFRQKIKQMNPFLATISLDNRYCGETIVHHTEKPLTIQQMAEDVLAVSHMAMDRLNLEKVSILGISMGGMIAQYCAFLAPFEHLFLVSTTAGGKSRTWPNQTPRLEFFYPFENMESTKQHMSSYFGDKFLKESPLLFDMMCKNMCKSAQNEDRQWAAKMQFHVSTRFDGEELLAQLKANHTVILTGDQDRVIPPENAFYLHHHILNSHLIVYQEVGHLILIEEPKIFLKDISDCF